MDKNYVSEAVIRRLPKYYRQLDEMEKNGIMRISSQELSVMMGLTASQIRQDFNCFGDFGQQGYGYQVTNLKIEISKILGIKQRYSVIIIGAGNVGQALANYSGFGKEGFIIKALFDVNPKLIGMSLHGIDVLDLDQLEEFISQDSVHIGVIATPKAKAQQVADRLAACGVKGIWNFAPVDVHTGGHVAIENVHLSDSLYILSYRFNQVLEQNSHV